MDPNLQPQSPNDADGKPSFRKPSSETVNRKYRRHSPVNESASSSSGSLNHGRSPSPILSRDARTKNSDESRRKDEDTGSHMDSGRSRPHKGGDSYRHSERQAHGRSHNYPRHNEYNEYRRHADEGKNYKKSSASGRDSRSNTSEYTRQENKSDKSRDSSYNAGKMHTRDKFDEFHEFHENKDKERETLALERRRHNDKHSSSDRSVSDRKPSSSSLNEVTTREGDRYHRHKRYRHDAMDYRKSAEEYKNNYTSVESRGEKKESTVSKDTGGAQWKESEKWNSNELHGQNGEVILKGKYDGMEFDSFMDCSNGGQDRNGNRSLASGGDGRNEHNENKIIDKDHESPLKKPKFKSDSSTCNMEGGHFVSRPASVDDERLHSNPNHNSDVVDTATAKPGISFTNEAGAADGLLAARVAAMKAAELVNKNLVGGGYMSTDQKKKLLWGSKKKTVAEESGHRWDVPLFSDRERQEKFNKLMGVKGEIKPEQTPSSEDSNGLRQAEKQEQLQLDLEKQYTAGLRRRDGRTVGLGL